MPVTEQKPLTFDGRVRSVSFALRDIRTMLVSQHNAWIHAAATLVVIAAGAVLIAAICAPVIGVLVFWPKLSALFA